jgi:enoyl-CoA hydratase
MEPAVIYERRGQIVHIRLNRPTRRNAVNTELLDGLLDALFRFDEDDDGWIAILSGEGKGFCSGVDLREGRRVLRRGRRTTVLLSRFENYKPVIAAVHGAVLGAGLLLALQSDLVVADATATFQITEVNRGVDGSKLWAYTLLRTSGAFADEFALTARECGAEEAKDCGLVHQVVAAGEHVRAAESLARDILRNPPLAVRAVVRSRRLRLEALETDIAATSRTRELNRSRDARESLSALREKRPPVFEAR